MTRAHRALRPGWGRVIIAITIAMTLGGAGGAWPQAALASAEPAPTPGCVFTGGAFTCGGSIPPDVEPGTTDPAPPTEPVAPEPVATEPTVAPSVSPSPAAPEPGAPPGPTPSPGAPAADDGVPDALPLWIAAAIGAAALVAAGAGAWYAASHRRGPGGDSSGE